MKNYTYGWVLEDDGYTEVPTTDYTVYQLDMCEFVMSMSEIIEKSKCGWDGVRYAVMKYKDTMVTEEYMVLYCDGGGSRWIPVTCNSKGCNFSVLGENLW